MSATSHHQDHDGLDPHARLRAYGWSAVWAAAFATQPPGLSPARVMEGHLASYLLATAEGERSGRVSGHLLHLTPEQLPAVGDWVAIQAPQRGDPAIIASVLPRRSGLMRPAAGPKPMLQVLGANVDVLFLVCSLDHDFSLNRLERYLASMAGCGAALELVLNKADLLDDPVGALAETIAIAGATPVSLVSAHSGLGLDALRARLTPGQTVSLIGSSGVGKSTLVNALLGGGTQVTQAVRGHDHGGQHTTTSRQLIAHPDGWVLMDTPGMRELRLVDETADVDAAFADIAELARHCRYRDCAHGGEPGCAVASAVEDGVLTARRLKNYRKLVHELDGRARFEARRSRAIQRRVVRGSLPPRCRDSVRDLDDCDGD